MTFEEEFELIKAAARDHAKQSAQLDLRMAQRMVDALRGFDQLQREFEKDRAEYEEEMSLGGQPYKVPR